MGGFISKYVFHFLIFPLSSSHWLQLIHDRIDSLHCLFILYDPGEFKRDVLTRRPLIEFNFHPQGGIKAVVYTDAWQVMVMFLSMVVIVVLGTITLGGFDNIFKIAADGDRIIFFK